VEWKHNALRHSFCSYRLADVKSAAEVALVAGNSPQMIFQHYRELGDREGNGAGFPEQATPDGAGLRGSRTGNGQPTKTILDIRG
jgi:hypothetical protein